MEAAGKIVGQRSGKKTFAKESSKWRMEWMGCEMEREEGGRS